MLYYVTEINSINIKFSYITWMQKIFGRKYVKYFVRQILIRCYNIIMWTLTQR